MNKLFDNSIKCVTKNPGIYYLKINEMNYIGSSISLKTRLLEHARRLLKGTHDNPRMQNTFDKYSQDKCWYSILESFENITQKELLQKEKEWIDLIGPVLNNKLDPTTQNNCNSNSKVVYQFNKQGWLLNEYPSSKEAYRQTSISASSIRLAANGKLLSAGGYLWSYDKKISKTYDLERTKWAWKAVKMQDLITGEELIFDNIAKAARHLNFENSNFDSICATISSICRGKCKKLRKRYTFNYI